ncbi:polyphosphate polymerase domain-containing protein [Glycomyces luteolus]|uniref:Polyphosphate polymerase domain-containing protein n=1 Tax=Glycomyces luteolus TaxID=2670330 RepID=A0A9X3PCD8_9ACTN|nr:polyphosphate polymerase domain-containing protein [Glycomyces luteolus]MDA1361501.1 polyphosphate polymerase domain-containing protein [Glycomyces luteolus]
MITRDGLDLFAPIDLAAVVDAANLQTRVDSKYLLTPEAYGRFRDRLARVGDWRCLEIEGRRRFAYESIYFDTPELLTYRQHRQGRRFRFKVRSRTYVDSGACAFEVKLKGARADTVKERMDYRAADAGRLAPDAADFLADTLHRAYGMAVPLGMAPRVRTDYRRHTLVDLEAAVRITCDEELRFSGSTGSAAARPLCLVEVKSAQAGGPVDRMLWRSGARPVSVSKYCLAAAALYPWLGANPWARAYKTCFGSGSGLERCRTERTRHSALAVDS